MVYLHLRTFIHDLKEIRHAHERLTEHVASCFCFQRKASRMLAVVEAVCKQNPECAFPAVHDRACLLKMQSGLHS